jgi:single-strand DNA-binding protein
MINKVTLIGNLGRDPEVRHLESGAMVATFTIATNENYKDANGEWQKLTEWHNVAVWRDLADKAGKQLKKGMLVYVEGKLTHRQYKDKEGKDRNFTEVLASNFRTLEKPAEYDRGVPFPSEPPQFAGKSFPQNAPEMGTTDRTSAPPAPESDDLPF